MNTMQLSREHQLLGGLFALVAGAVWVYYAVVFLPAFHTVMQLGQEVAATGKQLREIREALIQDPPLRQEQARLSQALEALRVALPSEEELPTMIQVLSEAASQSGVRIQTIAPQRSVETFGAVPSPSKKSSNKKDHLPPASPPPALYRQIPIQVDAVAGFHQLGMFVSRMESGPQAIRVTKLHVSSEKSKALRLHHIKLTVLGYFSVLPMGAEGS